MTNNQICHTIHMTIELKVKVKTSSAQFSYIEKLPFGCKATIGTAKSKTTLSSLAGTASAYKRGYN